MSSQQDCAFLIYNVKRVNIDFPIFVSPTIPNYIYIIYSLFPWISSSLLPGMVPKTKRTQMYANQRDLWHNGIVLWNKSPSDNKSHTIREPKRHPSLRKGQMHLLILIWAFLPPSWPTRNWASVYPGLQATGMSLPVLPRGQNLGIYCTALWQQIYKSLVRQWELWLHEFRSDICTADLLLAFFIINDIY